MVANAADGAIHTTVQEYALRNGVAGEDDCTAVYVRYAEDHSIIPFDPPVAVGVAVTTGMIQSTYFIGLIGRNETDASADATAVTDNIMASLSVGDWHGSKT